jgi:hypothetical protein
MEITVTEMSAGVYEVVAADVNGPRFRTTGADPQALIETARAWVLENGPSDCPARHYLGIYRLRLEMAKDGTTHPSAKAREFMETLVANLERLDRNTPVRLEIVCGVARFIDAVTGSVLGELKITAPGQSRLEDFAT